MHLSDVLCMNDLEATARGNLSETVWGYFNDGSEDGQALTENCRAFDKYKIRPRVLRDISGMDTKVEMSGTQISFPLAIAPSAMHCMAHPEGEKATARAAAKARVPMTLSTLATTSLEDVKKYGDEVWGNTYMLQLYVYNDRSATEKLVKRAEEAGYKALLLTVDTPVLGIRYTMLRHGFKLAPHLSLPNYDKTSTLPSANPIDGDGADQPVRGSLTWDETLPWLRSITNMEIWLKGVTTAEDVALAIQSPANISGIIVSNHGGRQLESALATLDSLPECVAEVRKSKKPFQVWLDGGIRKGSDIFKALALGADGVLIGRPPLWGLAAGGEAGVLRAIDILKMEFRNTMVLAGCATVADIKPSHLARRTSEGVYVKLEDDAC